MLSPHSLSPFQDGQTRLLQSCCLRICPLPIPLQRRHRSFGAAAMPCQARGGWGDTPKGTVARIAQTPLCKIQLWSRTAPARAAQ